jgi:hypothetical protein
MRLLPWAAEWSVQHISEPFILSSCWINCATQIQLSYFVNESSSLKCNTCTSVYSAIKWRYCMWGLKCTVRVRKNISHSNQIIFLQKEKIIYKWKKYICRVDDWMLFHEKQVAHGQIFLKPTLDMYSVTSRKKKQFRQY